MKSITNFCATFIFVFAYALGAWGAGEILWEFNLPAWYSESTPAIDELRHTIYVVSDGILYAIDINGTKKWEFNLNCDYCFPSPSVSLDGTVYVGSDKGILFAMKPDGTLKWSFNCEGSIDGSPSIAEDGTIYVHAAPGVLYAIMPNGALKWTAKLEQDSTGSSSMSSPAIGQDGTIYVCTVGPDGYVYAFNSDGTQKWMFYTGWGILASPAIGPDQTLYIMSGNASLYAIKPDGNMKWSVFTGNVGDNEFYSSAAISSSGMIYVGAYDKLVAFYPNGTEYWRFQKTYWADASPVIGNDGTIYSAICDHLYAISASGEELWSIEVDVSSDLTLDSNGVLYAVCRDKLVAINTDSPGPLRGSWAMYKHDASHSGYVNHVTPILLFTDFGHSGCGPNHPCEGDFDKDGDIDGLDLAVLADKLRS